MMEIKSMHTKMKHNSPASLQRFNSYFDRHNYRQHKLATVEIKSCIFVRECVSFMYAWM